MKKYLSILRTSPFFSGLTDDEILMLNVKRLLVTCPTACDHHQKLADYLCVERAAMSVELSKLQKEGLLKTNRNHFELLTS